MNATMDDATAIMTRTDNGTWIAGERNIGRWDHEVVLLPPGDGSAIALPAGPARGSRWVLMVTHDGRQWMSWGPIATVVGVKQAQEAARRHGWTKMDVVSLPEGLSRP